MSARYDPEEFEADDAAPEDDVERAAPWLVSFGDVTALMLTFFVMLFSMADIPSEKWDQTIPLISTSFTPEESEQIRPSSELNIDNVSLVNALPTAYLNRIFTDKLKRDPVLADATVTELDAQVVISLPSDALFRPGRAELLPEAGEAIFRLSGVLRQIGNRIDVQGHTDPDPPRADGFESNWSLSLARALNVSNALESAGYPGRLTAVGLGDSGYKHLDEDLSEARRYRLARRVDLVILPDADGQ
ncbi:MAG: flagellar motor protein MotB [Marivibrio sp.]|uniref:OmpA family protein n=1 Tax=Marivibrio sp. TaxID=2039719 RepID=UPI0032EC92C8